ncbi:NlpC/P60 family protein [Streptomyces sp. NPDC050211]|uniref:NlpC/P60 family protein n=1 Tax=Streptomyces sp. NPDC050211 TaxID=3154932 RepID=UPI003427028B
MARSRPPGPALLARALLIAVALVGTLLSAPAQQAAAQPPPPPPPTQPPPSNARDFEPSHCANWVVLSLAGGGHQLSAQEPFGHPQLNPYLWGITEALDRHGIGSSPPNVNPRPPVPSDEHPNGNYLVDLHAFPYNSGRSDYWANVEAAKGPLAQRIEWYDTTCGTSTNVILVGYSMGAHVIKRAMQEPLMKEHQDVVAGILNIADPSRMNNQRGMAGRPYEARQMETKSGSFEPIRIDSPVLPGEYERPSDPPASVESDPQLGGALGRIMVPEEFSGLGGNGRYFDICRTEDPFCNTGIPLTADAAPADINAQLVRLGMGQGPHTDYEDQVRNDPYEPGPTPVEMGNRVVYRAIQHQQHRAQTPPGPPVAPGQGGAGGGAGPVAPPQAPPPPAAQPDNPPPPLFDPNDKSCNPHGPTDGMSTAAIREACAEVAAGTWYTWGGGHSVSPPQATFGHVDSSDPERSRFDPQRKGFDCSGFVRYAYYKAAGHDILGDRTASQMYNASWPVRMTAQQGEAALLPGDLVFFGGPGSIHHVAIYLGNGMIVEAPQSNEKIRVAELRSHDDYAGAVRVSGQGGGGGQGNAPNSTWGTNVNTHTEPATGSPVHTTFPGPTGIRIDCQIRAETVTADGYTNDVWSHLPDHGGSWISNIYVKGPGWLPGIPACSGDAGSPAPPADGDPGGEHMSWGTDVQLRSGPSTGTPATEVLPGPTQLRIDCQARGEQVTSAGVTNDAWSHLPDHNAWISNIYIRGGAWIDGVPECATEPGGGIGDSPDYRGTWGDNVQIRADASQQAPVVTTLPAPSQVRAQCQKHAQTVTSEGYTNDAWSYLSDRKGWISNIYLKGGAWQDGIPECKPGNPPPT